MRTLLHVLVLLVWMIGLTACGGANLPLHSMDAVATPAQRPMDFGGADKSISIDGVEMKSEASADFRSAELAKSAPGEMPSAVTGQTKVPVSQQPGEISTIRAPMLIYTAEITMAVFQVTESLAKAEALARDLGGFLARRDDSSIVIRVPAGRFDEAVQRVENLGDMLHRNVAAEDVTEEFIDLEIRLRNALAIRDRLEKLLEKAAKVEESVLLERELGRIAGEIERLQGRMKYLRDRAAFSTITVRFQPRPSETISPTAPRLPVGWLHQLGLSRLLSL